MGKVDSVVSKTMGAAKVVSAAVHGLHGVFSTLAKQHGEAAALLKRARTSDEKFTELWPTIRRELLSHERAEMREIYPVLRQYGELLQMCDLHDHEAHQLEQLIVHIDNMPVDSQERRDQFAFLVVTVEDHAHDEETEIFPKAQHAIGTELAIELDAGFLRTKRQAAEGV